MNDNNEQQREIDEEPWLDEQRREGNRFLGTGLGIGAFGVATSVLLGAVCPVCVVAAPALVGAGIYKRICARRTPQDLTSEPDEASASRRGEKLA